MKLKDEAITLSGEKVRLRLIKKDDIEMLRNWRNQEAVRKCFVYSEKITKEGQLKWWESYSERENDLMFIIETRISSVPVGAVALYDITVQSAEFGRLMIGEELGRGKGYALEATELLTEFGLTVLKLKEINLEVFTNNIAAYRLYSKAGYKDSYQEGALTFMVKSHKY